LYSDAFVNGDVFAGSGAGNAANTAGVFNTAVGLQALGANINGNYNTVVGGDAMFANLSGQNNTAVGALSLSDATNANQNAAFGMSSLDSLLAGDYNAACGFSSLAFITNGSGNIALGSYSGANLLNGDNNIYIGNGGVDRDSGIVRIGTVGVQTNVFLAGDVIASGAVFSNGVDIVSDRNAKENFAPVDPREVLAKVAAMQVSKWNYKTAKDAVHIGPVAQDFHAAFDLNGKDDRHISVLDEGGVALAAIKGLNQKLDEKDAEIQKQNAEIQSLQQSLIELKAAVSQMSKDQAK